LIRSRLRREISQKLVSKIIQNSAIARREEKIIKKEEKGDIKI
jgi:hypothetical protein